MNYVYFFYFDHVNNYCKKTEIQQNKVMKNLRVKLKTIKSIKKKREK